MLTGDFNCRRTDPAYARMVAPFDERVSAFEDVWTVLHPGSEQPSTIGVHDREQWPEPFACDFIFASRDLRPRLQAIAVDAASRASDHQPLVLELG